MAYPIEKKLVIGIASSALFDLSDSDQVYRDKGVEQYRKYQRKKENTPLNPGVAFPLVKRLLKLNEGFSAADAPVEVVLLSRNDPDTGLRVVNSIDRHGLMISRAIFVSGGNPYQYMNALNACLFLSANATDVSTAVQSKLPAGRVFPTAFTDTDDDPELRVAFDFDGVVGDDASEAVYKTKGLSAFQQSEIRNSMKPVREGPLGRFFREISRLQRLEKKKKKEDPSYVPRLRTALVTARNAPAHKRVVSTFRTWGIEVDEVFFLGGIAKDRVLKVFKPHIFFDDQLAHITGAAAATPSAHVPFGVANELSPRSVRLNSKRAKTESKSNKKTKHVNKHQLRKVGRNTQRRKPA